MININYTPDEQIEQTTGGNIISLVCDYCIDELGYQQAVGYNSELEPHTAKTVKAGLRSMVQAGRRYEAKANCRHTRGFNLASTSHVSFREAVEKEIEEKL